MEERTNEQLKKLATRIPERLIGSNHAGRDASDHTVITQLLLLHLGPYSFEIVRDLYGKPRKDDEEVLVGCVGRLRCKIDGEEVVIEEYGGLENAGNQDGNGERGKHAASDALKRCAMRLGLGLHIWAQEQYFLDKVLKRSNSPSNESETIELPGDARTAEAEGVSTQDDGGEADGGARAPEPPKEEPGTEPGTEPVTEPGTEPGTQPEGVSQGGAANLPAGQKQNRSDMPARKSQIDLIRTLATEWAGQSGVNRLERRIGKGIINLTRAEADEWVNRLSDTPAD